MTVAAAINGQISSEGAALYALRYASVLGRAVELLHVKNAQDAKEEVESSMASIEEVAIELGVAVRWLFLEGDPARAVRDHLQERQPDILFCGTRVGNKEKKSSFGERLLAMRPDCDLAVIRTLHVGAALAVDRALMPIRKDRMSPEKFTFFATLLKGYGASGEIYSVTPLRARKRSDLEVGQVREQLERIDRRLSHYTRLAGLAGLSLHLKHAYAGDEAAQILHHLHHHGYQLLVLGGRRPLFPFVWPSRIERLLEVTPVNTIFFYARGRRACCFSR